MKRLLIIMFLLVAFGIANAARITVHADTSIKLRYSINSSNYWIDEDDNSIYVPVTPRFYDIVITWFSVCDNRWITEYPVHVDVWNMNDDIHLYYQFITANLDPNIPINQ